MPADASSACAKLTDPEKSCELVSTARAETRRFGPWSAPRAHTRAPYKPDIYDGKREGRLTARDGPDRRGVAARGGVICVIRQEASARAVRGGGP